MSTPRPREDERKTYERPHVLIVTDDPSLIEFLGEGLVMGGFWTSVISHGLQVLEVFRLRTFDLIVVDRDLGTFDAIELIERATNPLRPSLWVAGSAAVLVIVSGVRLHAMLPDYGVDRSPELSLGRQIAERVPPGERVAIEPSDYGYFAIMAASGRPEMLTVTRSLDPRKKDEPRVMPPDAKWIAVKQNGAWTLGARN